MGPKLGLEANAKINLTLDVTGKRPDGYHTICSVFQSVTLCDRLSLSDAPDRELHVLCDRPELSCGWDNTVRRAAEAYFQAAGVRAGVSFFLEKRIPWQAGLGGGSADAAAALRLLNRFFDDRFSDRELLKIGCSVGADVPFCLFGGTALAEGIGEKLTRLPPIPDCRIVICKPSAGIGTREAYEALDRQKRGSKFTGPMLEALGSGGFRQVACSVGNVFEEAFSLPQSRRAKRMMLEAGAAGACMTGTGSAVFGLFERAGQAQLCLEQLAGFFSETYLCRPADSI